MITKQKNRSLWNQPSTLSTQRPLFNCFVMYGLFYENRARWTKMSNVFTKCFATLENSFFKSLESLFINYVLFRSERAAVCVNDCSMVFSSVVYNYFWYRARIGPRRWHDDFCFLAAYVCLLRSRVYASGAHLNRKLNYRRLDKKQQRSILNRACCERAPNNDALACVQDWVSLCAEGRQMRKEANCMWHIHAHVVNVIVIMDEYVKQTERQSVFFGDFVLAPTNWF